MPTEIFAWMPKPFKQLFRRRKQSKQQQSSSTDIRNNHSVAVPPPPEHKESATRTTTRSTSQTTERRCSNMSLDSLDGPELAYDSVPILEQTKLPRGGVSVETKAVGRIQVRIFAVASSVAIHLLFRSTHRFTIKTLYTVRNSTRNHQRLHEARFIRSPSVHCPGGPFLSGHGTSARRESGRIRVSRLL